MKISFVPENLRCHQIVFSSCTVQRRQYKLCCSTTLRIEGYPLQNILHIRDFSFRNSFLIFSLCKQIIKSNQQHSVLNTIITNYSLYILFLLKSKLLGCHSIKLSAYMNRAINQETGNNILQKCAQNKKLRSVQ